MPLVSGENGHAPEIELQDLSFGFEHKTVFHGLNLTFPAGQWSVILGPSGGGKSTLLRMIAGSLKPKSGAIIFGENSTPKEPVAWMAQDDLLLPWLTVTENILLGARLRKTVTLEKERRVQQLLADTNLEAEKDALPQTLSGGMRQRVALLRTLIEDRSVILMDEPFSALDALTRLRLQNLFARLVVNTTVVLVTHDPVEALRLGHRIIVLNEHPAAKIHQLDLTHKRPRDPSDPEMAALHKTLLNYLMGPEPR